MSTVLGEREQWLVIQGVSMPRALESLHQAQVTAAAKDASLVMMWPNGQQHPAPGIDLDLGFIVLKNVKLITRISSEDLNTLDIAFVQYVLDNAN